MAAFSAEQLQQLKQVMREDTIATIKTTQKELLQSAAATASKISEAGVKESAAKLRDAIDEEVGYTQEDCSFKNNINRSNFDFCREVEALWKRAGRAVEDSNRTKAAEIIDKGKKLTRKRMKCFKLADREGWAVALAYLSDDLASDDDQAKKLKNARKEVKSKRDEDSSFSGRRNRDWDSRDHTQNWGAGASRYEGYRNNSRGEYGNRNNTRRSGSGPTCYRCGRLGHRSANCSY